MKSLSPYDWVVIGEGISTEFFLYWLSKASSKKLKILQISSPIFTSGSKQSTSLIIPFDIKPGISEFGDLLCISREFMQQWLVEEKTGADTDLRIEHYGSDNIFRERFAHAKKQGELFMFSEAGQHVDWEKLKAYLRDEQVNLEISRVEDTFLDFTENSNHVVVNTANNNYEAIKVFTGLGHGNCYFQQSSKPKGKMMAGDYCSWNDVQILKENSLISYNGWNALQLGNDFIFSASSIDRGFSYAIDWPIICKHYEEFMMNFTHISFPPLNEAKSTIGFRHKLRKRRPAWGQIGENVYYIAGLHKNGFILANYLSKECVKMAEVK